MTTTEKKFQIKGAIEALCYLMLSATFFSLLAGFWWVFELATHFRIQYILMLTFALLFWAKIKKWKVFTLFLLAFLINCYYVVPDFFPPPEITTPQTTTLKIMTYNVFYGNQNFKEAIHFLENSGCDFIVLEEVTNAWEKQFSQLQKTYPYQKGISREDSFGIWLLSRRPLLSAEISYLGVGYGVPSIKAEVEYENEKFVVIGTHPVPPVSEQFSQRRNEHLQKLSEYIQSQTKPVVLTGDFNMTPWSPYFIDFLKNVTLLDTRKGYGIQNTWPSTNPIFWIPIDHCFVSKNIKVHTRQVLNKSYGSDHFPVIVEFSLPKK